MAAGADCWLAAGDDGRLAERLRLEVNEALTAGGALLGEKEHKPEGVAYWVGIYWELH